MFTPHGIPKRTDLIFLRAFLQFYIYNRYHQYISSLFTSSSHNAMAVSDCCRTYKRRKNIGPNWKWVDNCKPSLCLQIILNFSIENSRISNGEHAFIEPKCFNHSLIGFLRLVKVWILVECACFKNKNFKIACKHVFQLNDISWEYASFYNDSKKHISRDFSYF